MSRRNNTKIFMNVILIILSIASIAPFYIMIVMGTYKSSELFRGVHLLPGSELWFNLQSIFEAGFLKYYSNSFIVAVISTVLSVIISMAAGFAFAKYEFRGKKVLFIFVMATMMIPYQVALVGYLVEMRTIGLMGTLWPLIFLGIANGFGVFWARQYIMSFIPLGVIESAKIDGANDFKIFLQIVLPMCKPVVLTLVVLSFSNSWNSYLAPLVLISDEKLYTMNLALSKLNSLFTNDYALQIAALAIGTIPVLILFSFASKYFVQGLNAGSVKG